MFKTRLDLRGNPIGAKTWHKLGDTFTDPEALKKHHEEKSGQYEEKEGEAGKKQRKCGNCYGAGEEGEVRAAWSRGSGVVGGVRGGFTPTHGPSTQSQCCNTCEEVREAYKRKGWAFIGLNVEQCQEEAAAAFPVADAEEGCNVHGSLILTQASQPPKARIITPPLANNERSLTPPNLPNLTAGERQRALRAGGAAAALRGAQCGGPRHVHLPQVQHLPPDPPPLPRGRVPGACVYGCCFWGSRVGAWGDSRGRTDGVADSIPCLEHAWLCVQGFKSPLSNQARSVEDGYGMYQYYLKVCHF